MLPCSTTVYLIDRFDRVKTAQGWQRRHTLDACQLLDLERSFKYSQGSIDTLARLATACRSPAVARPRLFAWLVFNVLIGNSDAHLKNLSFLVSHEGARPVLRPAQYCGLQHSCLRQRGLAGNDSAGLAAARRQLFLGPHAREVLLEAASS